MPTLCSEYRIVRPDGQIRWINATGRGVYDEQGRPVRMAGICLDISAQKRAEEALRSKRSNAAGNPFTAMTEGFALPDRSASS